MKCLVTKLMSSVQDEELKELGVIKVVVNDESFNLSGDKLDTEISWNGVELTGETFNLTGIGVFRILNKYTMTKLRLNKIDISDLRYCSKLEDLFIDKGAYGDLDFEGLNPNIKTITINDGATDELIYGSIDDLSQFTSLEKIYINCGGESYITGNINCLANIKTLTSIKIFGGDVNNTTIQGDIKVLGGLTELTSMNFSGCKGVGGKIEQFVKAQIVAGRTTNSDGVRIPYPNSSGITYFGTKPTVNDKVTWDSTSITYNGVTHDLSEIE